MELPACASGTGCRRMRSDDHAAILERLAGDLRARLVVSAGEPGDDLQERIRALVDREAALLDEATREQLVALIAERSFGLGPLEALLRDPAVDEVMVNGPGAVWVERAGRVEPTGVSFAGEGELRHAIERILAPLGRRVDEAEPLCDARLPDGSRVNGVIPPIAVSGPVLKIRRVRARGRRTRADNPRVPLVRLVARRAGGAGDVDPAAARRPGAGGGGPAQRPG